MFCLVQIKWINKNNTLVVNWYIWIVLTHFLFCSQRTTFVVCAQICGESKNLLRSISLYLHSLNPFKFTTYTTDTWTDSLSNFCFNGKLAHYEIDPLNQSFNNAKIRAWMSQWNALRGLHGSVIMTQRDQEDTEWECVTLSKNKWDEGLTGYLRKLHPCIKANLNAFDLWWDQYRTVL